MKITILKISGNNFIVYNGLAKIMFMNEENKLNLGSVINWVATSEKLPTDVENYLVYGDGMYTVTFYSHRRKRWNTDFNVEYYATLPKPPCL